MAPEYIKLANKLKGVAKVPPRPGSRALVLRVWYSMLRSVCAYAKARCSVDGRIDEGGAMDDGRWRRWIATRSRS